MSHMHQTTISGDIQAIAQEAGPAFAAAAGQSHQDARVAGLRYLLARLSLLGRPADFEQQKREIAQLRELAQLAFHDLDTTEVANQIRNDPSVSPLALAIASIVQTSPAQQRKWVMLGAVSAAYLGLTEPDTQATRDSRKLKGILGAIGGAVAASIIELFQNTERFQSEEGFLGFSPSTDNIDDIGHILGELN